MQIIRVKSFAKINLSLKIKGVRNDGFHEIRTIMQNVSLFDEIAVSKGAKGIVIDCADDKVPVDENNFCHKAAVLLAKERNIEPNIHIHIKKNIPVEAGLGGGSSNAAAVICALNKLWDLKLGTDKLALFASKTGSDTAFFIHGGKALCSGRGEIVKKMPGPRTSYYVIVKPEISVSTKWAYQEWDKSRTSDPSENDLQSVVIKKYPEIGSIIKQLNEAGCSVSQMTGSGSAVFGKIESFEEGQKVLAVMRQKYQHVFLVETIDRGVEIV